MSRPFTVAQVGCGYWGPNLLRVFSELGGVKRLCDLSPGRLAWAKQRYPHLEVSQRYEDILEDPEVDAVVIATVVVTHYELARKALEAGKHVFVEKPLAHSAVEAQRLADLARKKHRALGVGHVFLYHPAFRTLKAELAAGKLGRPCYADFVRINPGPPAPKHDVIWDMAPHDAAMAIDLGGKPRSVRALGRRYLNDKLDEAAFFDIEFDKGFVGRIHVSWLSSRRVRRVEVYGTAGSAFYDDVEPFEKLRLVSRGEDTRVGAKQGEAKSLYYAPGDIRIPALAPEEPLKAEAADFLAACREGRQPLSGPEIGVRVVRVLEAAAQSAATGKTVRLK